MSKLNSFARFTVVLIVIGYVGLTALIFAMCWGLGQDAKHLTPPGIVALSGLGIVIQAVLTWCLVAAILDFLE